MLSLLAFCGVFFGLRALHEIFMRLSPALRRPERPFYVRLITVLYMVMVGALAVLAALLVLYVAGDWVLLGLALLFLLGLVWASRNTVPLFFEQIRLLLNVGTVREQERVIYNGLLFAITVLTIHSSSDDDEVSVSGFEKSSPGSARHFPWQRSHIPDPETTATFEPIAHRDHPRTTATLKRKDRT